MKIRNLKKKLAAVAAAALLTFSIAPAPVADAGWAEIIAGGRVLSSPSDGRERGIGLGIVILPR